MSNTLSEGFDRVSPNTSLVLGWNFDSSSSTEISGSTNVDSIPKFFNVLAIRLYVPPYIVEHEITWSPAPAILIIANRLAAWPDEVSIAATPPSSWQIFLATASFVGFASLV